MTGTRDLMMNRERLETILARLPQVRIAVLGDFFLDRYWEIDAARDEPSVETGLTAYQIVGRRQSPGAAGTVVSNLAALEIGTIRSVGFVGEDGEGVELIRLLDRLDVDRSDLVSTTERMTPCYTKPMRDGIEMNRFDIKNRTPTPAGLERRLIAAIRQLPGQVDAIMVMDQVSEENAGVVTGEVREALSALGRTSSGPLLYADSRERIGRFRDMIVKCNDREATETFGCYTGTPPEESVLRQCALRLAERNERTVFVTRGPLGQLVVERDAEDWCITPVSAVRVDGEIDICGAGDATSSALVASLCAGATFQEAALIGNLAASVTIRQIGSTGTAGADDIREAFQLFERQQTENAS